VVHVETRVESDWFPRWKLTYDKLLSSFAFDFNLRRYASGCFVARKLLGMGLDVAFGALSQQVIHIPSEEGPYTITSSPL
jgi:hypothetical protein